MTTSRSYFEDLHYEEAQSDQLFAVVDSIAVHIALMGIRYHCHLTKRCSDGMSPGYGHWIMDDAYIVSFV